MLELSENYGVTDVVGFRNGYQGLVAGCEPIRRHVSGKLVIRTGSVASR